MGYIVPLYDPLRIVEEAAVLDNVLDGRLELGLVTGISPQYFTHYRADFANRRALTHEGARPPQNRLHDPGHLQLRRAAPPVH